MRKRKGERKREKRKGIKKGERERERKREREREGEGKRRVDKYRGWKYSIKICDEVGIQKVSLILLHLFFRTIDKKPWEIIHKLKERK